MFQYQSIGKNLKIKSIHEIICKRHEYIPLFEPADPLPFVLQTVKLK